MNNISQEIIQKYIDKGFSVFPVQVSKQGDKFVKKPQVEWADYQTRFATSDEIAVWCAMLDFNGLGMATGKISGVTVLDLDDPSITDFDSCVKVRTVSGGYHLWYKYKHGLRNAVRVQNRLIDIRGDGGFVVIPPTTISSQYNYSWISYDFENMPEFPVVVQAKKEHHEVMSELPTAGDGQRNQTAIRVAGHMVKNTDRPAWETTAWPALLRWNETMVTPPLGEFELRRTFESACRMEGAKKPELAASVAVFTGKQIDTEYLSKIELWKSGIPTGYDKLDEYFTFMPEQLYLLSAPTHHGKTTVAFNFAARAASYGFNSMFCSLEQGIFITPRIKSAIGHIPDTFSILTSDGLMSVKQLVDIVSRQAQKVDILFIDHLHFMDKDTRNGITSAIEAMMIDIQNAAKKLSIPIVVITHLRKLNEDREPTLDDLKDSSALSQVPSVVIQLYATKKEDGVMHQDTGGFMIRKNRITGKLGKLSYQILDTGEVRILDYIDYKIRI